MSLFAMKTLDILAFFRSDFQLTAEKLLWNSIF